MNAGFLTGARLTDQGLIEGRAAEVMCAFGRGSPRACGASSPTWTTSSTLQRPITPATYLEEEVAELVDRGALADAVLVTGSATGAAVELGDLDRVRLATRAPVFAASGATEETAASLLARCDGIIVGTAIKRGGRAGNAVDLVRARRFARRARRG